MSGRGLRLKPRAQAQAHAQAQPRAPPPRSRSPLPRRQTPGRAPRQIPGATPPWRRPLQPAHPPPAEMRERIRYQQGVEAAEELEGHLGERAAIAEARARELPPPPAPPHNDGETTLSRILADYDATAPLAPLGVGALEHHTPSWARAPLPSRAPGPRTTRVHQEPWWPAEAPRPSRTQGPRPTLERPSAAPRPSRTQGPRPTRALDRALDRALVAAAPMPSRLDRTPAISITAGEIRVIWS